MEGKTRLDPRLYQIGILTVLLVYGVGWLEFDVTLGRIALIIGTALATQLLCTRLWKLPAFDPKSALISALSLCLLLRTDESWVAALGAVIAIASKFLIRVRGKHLFNPTNGAIVALILLGKGWVSPGQWGNLVFFAFLMACLGGLVVNRAARSDVTYAFMVSYLALVFYRSWYLGEPMTIPVHRLENGGLLLFTFFMISDPKTTPDSRMGRVIWAEFIAAGAYYVQFKLFRTNGLMWSLALFAMLTPLIDFLLRGERYVWGAKRVSPDRVVVASPVSRPAALNLRSVP